MAIHLKLRSILPRKRKGRILPHGAAAQAYGEVGLSCAREGIVSFQESLFHDRGHNGIQKLRDQFAGRLLQGAGRMDVEIGKSRFDVGSQSIEVAEMMEGGCREGKAPGNGKAKLSAECGKMSRFPSHDSFASRADVLEVQKKWSGGGRMGRQQETIHPRRDGAKPFRQCAIATGGH